MKENENYITINLAILKEFQQKFWDDCLRNVATVFCSEPSYRRGNIRPVRPLISSFAQTLHSRGKEYVTLISSFAQTLHSRGKEYVILVWIITVNIHLNNNNIISHVGVHIDQIIK